VTVFRKISLKVRIAALALAVMLVSAVAAFAQATPEAYSSTTLLSAGSDMMNTWNLWPFVIVAAVVGIVVYLLRRARKATM
jgi:type II secretory pathway component PulF